VVQCPSSSIFLQPLAFGLVKHLPQKASAHGRWPGTLGSLHTPFIFLQMSHLRNGTLPSAAGGKPAGGPAESRCCVTWWPHTHCTYSGELRGWCTTTATRSSCVIASILHR